MLNPQRAIGMLSMVAPLYISEISPPEIRGALLVLEELCIVTGIVVAYWITYGTRYMAGEWSWRLPFLLQMIPGGILGVGILFLPFSPRWLVSKGRDAEALKALGQLRSLSTTDTRIQQEWFDIRAEVVSRASWFLLSSVLALSIGCKLDLRDRRASTHISCTNLDPPLVELGTFWPIPDLTA